jgi:hypothetical protein
VRLLTYFSAIGGHIVRIHTVRTARGRGHENQGKFGTIFEAILSVFLVFGSYRSVCTIDYGHTFQGVVF